MVPTSVEPRLLALRAHYTSLINAAVGAGRMDMVEDLANAHEDEALDLLLTSGSGPGSRSDRPAEILGSGAAGHPGARPVGPTFPGSGAGAPAAAGRNARRH